MLSESNKEDPYFAEIPECLRRDKNNVAPFMKTYAKEYDDRAESSRECILASLATNPQETTQCWLPPWESKT